VIVVSGVGVFAGLPGLSTWSLVAPMGLEGQVTASGFSRAAVNRANQACSQGQATGRCRCRRRAELAMRAGTVMSWARIVAQTFQFAKGVLPTCTGRGIEHGYAVAQRGDGEARLTAPGCACQVRDA
jgi:hypothetical protein